MVDSVDRLVSEAEQREARDHLYRLAVITLTARQFADTPEGAARAVVDAVLGSGEAVYVALGVGEERDRLRAVVQQAATTPHENYSPERRRVALHRIVTAARAALAGPENPKVTVHSNLTTDTVKKIESTENYGAGPENPPTYRAIRVCVFCGKPMKDYSHDACGPENPEEDERV